MTAKHPSFIFKRHEGTSYLFRSVFPNDLRELCHFPRELTISLKTGIKTEAIRLASILKIQLDGIFTDIRSGNITETCVSSVKNQLKVLLLKNKLSIGGVDNNSFNDNAYTLETFLQFQAQYKSQPSLMKLTSNHKLVKAYVSRFVLEDIFSFCDQHDIDYNVSDFPRKHIRRAREVFFNLICRDIGLDTFAEQMATEVLKIHLESIEYKDFVKFLKSYKAAKEEIHVLLEESEHVDHEELIQAIGEFYQISEIALKLGIDVLFSDSPDETQTTVSGINKEYQEKDVWIALKSKTANAPSKDAGSKISLNKCPTIDVEKVNSEPDVSSDSTLSDVVHEYCDEMVRVEAWGPKSALEIRSMLSRMVDIIGNIPPNKLSHEYARKYKNILMKLPPNMSKDVRYRHLSIDQVLELEDVKPISTNTINNHLSFVIALMNWAKKHGYITENYFEGLKVTKSKKAKDERQPFSSKDLKKIFDAERYIKETKGIDSRYWIPLIALYTGGRLGELSQLHIADIKKEQGIWCIHITTKGETKDNPKKLKNKTSERMVPIHPVLIELGFLEFVTQQKTEKKSIRLFPDLSYDRSNFFTRKVGRWFNEFYLRGKLDIDTTMKSFHSFRHTVANGLKQKGVAESFISELLGHSAGSTQSFTRYGKDYRPKVLMEEAVKKIEYQLDIQKLKR